LPRSSAVALGSSGTGVAVVEVLLAERCELVELVLEAVDE
jgi:hypothetical protein